MRGDGVGSNAPPDAPARFPFVRRRGPAAIVGLSTAVPTAPFLATGRLGGEQVMRLQDTLATLAHEGRFRIVLIHHPPFTARGDYLKRLVDAGPFLRALEQAGAELVLHGHTHVHSLAWIEGKGPRIPVVGVPSASAVGHGERDPAAYNLYRIDGTPGAWQCELVTRGIQRSRPGLGELRRKVLRQISA